MMQMETGYGDATIDDYRLYASSKLCVLSGDCDDQDAAVHPGAPRGMQRHRR